MASTPARLVLRGGRIVDPSQELDRVADLWIEDGRVARIADSSGGAEPGDSERQAGPGGAKTDVEIDARGLVVVPGLIELRAQLGEPGHEHRETLASGLAAAAAGGYTALGALPSTDPPIDRRPVVEMLRADAARLGSARLHPIAAISRGLAGEALTEMGELSEAGAVAVADGDRLQGDAAFLRRALLYARHFGLPVFCRAGDPSLEAGGVMHEGEWSTRLGLRGIPALSEESVVARDLLLAEETGGHYHLAPVTTRGALERVRRARRDGVSVTCDATPAHLLLTDQAVAESGFSTALRLAPPLRSQDDLEALLEGCADGTIDVLTGDHRPYHADEKADVQFGAAPPGASALETTVAVCLDRLVGRGFLELPRLVELLSTGPARVLGLDPERVGAGTLRPGAIADVTLLDLERETTIDPARFRSLGRSTPFAGWTLRGGAVATVLDGRLVGGHDLEPERLEPERLEPGESSS